MWSRQAISLACVAALLLQGLLTEAATQQRGFGLRNTKRKAEAQPVGEEEFSTEASVVLEGVDVDKEEVAQALETFQVARGNAVTRAKFEGGPKPVDVAFCTDDGDLRPLAAAINSTIVNARSPERLFFHLVLPPALGLRAGQKLRLLFPDANIAINRHEVDISSIKQRIVFLKGTGVLQGLASPYNFIPFYLPHICPDVERIIYLDADVIVRRDIAELADMYIGEFPAAVVEDCSQTYGSLMDFKVLSRIKKAAAAHEPGRGSRYDKMACVFNRGVMLVNVNWWLAKNVSGVIEWWMDQSAKEKTPLYRHGQSQAPFLLALTKKYLQLPNIWNVRGLARDEFIGKEKEYLAKIGFGKDYFDNIKTAGRSPYVSPLADEAAILHFNGPFRPWKRRRVREVDDEAPSLCGRSLVDCAAIWWQYLGPESEHLLSEI